MINIKKGLDLPIGGKPVQSISDSPMVKHVALLASDYIGLRPSMAVEPGDQVKKGQVLFEDKKNPGTRFTAPVAGKVVAVNRGARRAFQSLVIEVDNNGESVEFKKTSADKLLELSCEEVVSELVESGMWTAFRTRPFDKVPQIGSLPHSIFVTAMDTNPLAADAKVIIDSEAEAFTNGIRVLSRIGVKVFVCKNEKSLPSSSISNVQEEVFTGPHPAGLPGVHIHYLDPVSEEKTVWHIGYQDVIAIGHLFVEGEYYNRRVVALAGPCATNPRLIATVQGASVTELVSADEIKKTEHGVRIISGTVLWGNRVEGPFAYLGRYHQGIALIEEGNQNEFFLQNWMGLGFKRHSITRAFVSGFIKPSEYTFNTALNGGPRPIMPIGNFDKVLPFDVEGTMLMRAIDINDVDQAKLLGILELSEEDIALCTYVCPGKTDYGPLLRRSLTKIEVEG